MAATLRQADAPGESPRGLRARTVGLALGAAAAVFALWVVLRDEPVTAPPGRYAVVSRGLAWTALSTPADAPPLSRSWDLSADFGSWLVANGDAEWEDGAMVLTGKGSVDLFGPADARLDPRLVHHLQLEVRTRAPLKLGIHWHAAGDERTDSRPTEQWEIRAGAPTWTTVEVALGTIPGLMALREAGEPYGELHLSFGEGVGRGIRVGVRSIRLLSDYDATAGASGPLEVDGAVRPGVAVRAPMVMALPPIALHGADRLRFATCVIGTHEPLSVTLHVRWGDGRHVEKQVLLRATDGWQAQRFDIASGHGQALALAQVTLQATVAPSPDTMLLLGDAMHLAPSPGGGPSIVLYLEDTLRADHLGVNGYAPSTDPYLQTLGEQGAVFETVHAPSSWTRPSVSSLLTSLDSAGHGNRDPGRRVPPAATTLAEALADAGWITASFVSNPHAGAWSGLDQGFDVQTEAFVEATSRSTLTSQLLRAPLLAFLAEHRDERMFLYAHSMDPHAPYEPDPASLATLRADSAPRPAIDGPDAAHFAEATLLYDAEIRHNDGELAVLAAGIEGLGLGPDMLFAFTSDHGESFGEHGHWDHRTSVHDEELRVPWVLHWKGGVAAGGRVDAPVSLLDVAPTLLGLAGVPVPATWQGRDLAPLVRAGDPPPRPPEATLFIDTVYAEPIGGVLHAVAGLHWPLKLVASVDAGGRLHNQALFSLDDDPHELHDRLADPALAPAVRALTDFLVERLAAPEPGEDATATLPPWDPTTREWMLRMGYLR